MAKIVYTDQETFEEPVIEVDDRLSESQITATIGHDDWDYVIADVPVTHAMKPKKGMVAAAAAIALLPLLILPVSAEWQSRWRTEWVDVENGRYEVPYFPGKRKISGRCYFIHLDSLQSEEPDAASGECYEG
ncbi:MAG: hypothetical protein DCF15_19290 [Phormidesmis priestleyi]|uniref:Uncharacterized protein n=1 Tax=Phormidesmis priestleyi TaxID=268141 RepID=A0A2W4WVT5_9CYAN|nr:MAG: hypothetical protein DCF15_19290 [Phormidesmis priestleyi]